MKIISFAVAVAVTAFTLSSAQAELKVAAVFGDNMVLQQQMSVPVWGWSEPGARVTVSFAGRTRSTHADGTGKWLVKLGKLEASAEPRTLIVQAGESKSFTNVLVGEVWLASGQSNMEKPIGKQTGQKPTLNFEAELAAANYPNIRLFKVGRTLAAAPETDLSKFDGWRECSSNTLEGINFSAAAYFFGREIHTNLNVPVGLVESSWGGTRIEPWTPPAGFNLVPALADLADTELETNKLVNTRPMAIYNSMIAPITGFAMRGALWYQGESNLMGTNADNDYLNYDQKMAALVGGWRKTWGEGSFPFYFVQIAPFKYYGGKKPRVASPEMLPEFWTLQSRAVRQIRHTGMVVTTDLVDDLNDIHPRDKASVGHRLALLALRQTYDRDVVCSGPVFRKVRFRDGKAILWFDHAEGGLRSKDGQPLTWFTMAGADGRFVAAEAKIVGDTVEVSAAWVQQPKAVRFAWDETAQPNFCNGAGLPAEPFQTDGRK